MASFDPISCFPSLTAEHPEVDFTDGERCSYIDILRYEDVYEPVLNEGKLGGDGLEGWFLKACCFYAQNAC
jgi:hypothetical protein